MKSANQINLTEKEIAEVAENLDMGYVVFYNFETNETKSLIDRDTGFDIIEEEVEIWKEIDENFEDYHEFEKMDSRNSFLVMEDFAGQVEDEKFKNRLMTVLNRRKPFAHFKDEVETNWDYREDWFAFKQKKSNQWVKQQIEDFNEASEL